ncbi:MAG: hypothetical protein M1823_001273 [Watsoniomyces obsoletus]|nr:MAG: hypothetical protein M1823_001273 [Watsoniomyces obsoletus]
MSLRLTRKFREGGEKDSGPKRGWFGTLPKRKSVSWLLQNQNELQTGSTSPPAGPSAVIEETGKFRFPPDFAPTDVPGRRVASSVKRDQRDDAVSRQSDEADTFEPQMSGACVTLDRPTTRHSGHSMTKGLRNSFLQMSPTKSLSKAFKSLRSPRKKIVLDGVMPVLLVDDEQFTLAETSMPPVESKIPTISDVVIPSSDLALPSQSSVPANGLVEGEVVAEIPPPNSEPSRQVTPAKSTIVAPFSSLQQHWTEQVISAAELDINQAREGQKRDDGCNNTQITLNAILSEAPSEAGLVAVTDRQEPSSAVPVSTERVSTEAEKKITPEESTAPSTSSAISRRPSIQRTTSLRRDLDRLANPAVGAPSTVRKTSGVSTYEADMEDNNEKEVEESRKSTPPPPSSPPKKFYARKRTIIPWGVGSTSRDDLPSQQALAGLRIDLRQSSEQLRLLRQKANNRNESQSNVSGHPSSMPGGDAADCKVFQMTLDEDNAEAFRQCAEKGIYIQWGDAVGTNTSPLAGNDDNEDEEKMAFDEMRTKARVNSKSASDGAKMNSGNRNSTDSGIGSSIVSNVLSIPKTRRQETKAVVAESNSMGKEVILDLPPPYELSATTPSIGTVRDTKPGCNKKKNHRFEATPQAMIFGKHLQLENLLELTRLPSPALSLTHSLPRSFSATENGAEVDAASTTVECDIKSVENRINSSKWSPSSSEGGSTPTSGASISGDEKPTTKSAEAITSYTTSLDSDLSALERYLVGGPLAAVKTGHRHQKLFMDCDKIIYPESMTPEGWLYWKLPDPMIPLSSQFSFQDGSALSGNGTGEALQGRDYYHCKIREYPSVEEKNKKHAHDQNQGILINNSKEDEGIFSFDSDDDDRETMTIMTPPTPRLIPQEDVEDVYSKSEASTSTSTLLPCGLQSDQKEDEKKKPNTYVAGGCQEEDECGLLDTDKDNPSLQLKRFSNSGSTSHPYSSSYDGILHHDHRLKWLLQMNDGWEFKKCWPFPEDFEKEKNRHHLGDKDFEKEKNHHHDEEGEGTKGMKKDGMGEQVGVLDDGKAFEEEVEVGWIGVDEKGHYNEIDGDEGV